MWYCTTKPLVRLAAFLATLPQPLPSKQQQHHLGLWLLLTSVVVKRTWDSRTRTWKLVLEDKNFPRGQQHCCEAVRWDRHELETDRDTMANRPPIHYSVTARRWCLLFHMLHWPIQSSKIFEDLNFRGRGQEQGLVVRWQGQGLENWSSRILEDNNTVIDHC